MTLSVRLLVEAEGLLAVRSVRNDRLGSPAFEPLPQLRAVIGLIAEKLFGRFDAADHTIRDGAIMRLATAQEDGKKTAFSICDCMDLRIAPAT